MMDRAFVPRGRARRFGDTDALTQVLAKALEERARLLLPGVNRR